MLIASAVTAISQFHAAPATETPPPQNVEEIVKKEIPALLSETNPLEIARLTLPWAASVSDWGGGKTQFHNLSANEIYYNCWLADHEGTSCGGMALFYKKLLHLLGVSEAFTLNFGVPNTNITQVTVIVPIRTSTGYDFFMFDPLTGTYFVDAKGQYASLTKVLTEPVTPVQVEFERDFIGPPNFMRRIKGIPGTENTNITPNKTTGLQYTREVMLSHWTPGLIENGFDLNQEILPQLLRRKIISHDGGSLGDLLTQQIADAPEASAQNK